MVRIILLKLIESFFQMLWLATIAIIAMTALGFYWAQNKAPTYTSTGTLYIEKDSLLASLTAASSEMPWWVTKTPAERTIAEIEELLATQSFARSALVRTDFASLLEAEPKEVDATIDSFRQMLSMSTLGEKTVRITGTSEDPETAQQVVDAVLDSYVEWKLIADYQESVVAQNFFAELIGPYQDDLRQARNDLMLFLQDYPEPNNSERPIYERMEIARLEAEVERAEWRVDETKKNEESARLALAQSEALTRQTYTIIDVPQVPLEHSRSMTAVVIDIAIFAVVGVAMGVAIILLNAIFDHTFRFALDVRKTLNLPVLAVVVTAKRPWRDRLPWRRKRPVVRPVNVTQTSEPHPALGVLPQTKSNVK
ncbi:MAG: lipopolysaccharide biosynthesis protein [Candidatus Viridilinea halotolerans]|uniref:Lipopolysaccharide biosynthesis protein n=1 Tax=Candidatus Viridilinea halotolerans TaxID=2491704 RepID=A0A426TR81_9CHLR|nr:MAG: lipopolysaccharide biosynthesis protein [Candidatus Viridilinea halotolerans]